MLIKKAFLRSMVRAFGAIAISGAASSGAIAQGTDFNLESRFDTFVPKVTHTTSPRETERVVVRQPPIFKERIELVPLTEEQRMNLLAQKEGLAIHTLRARTPEEIANLLKDIPKTVSKKVKTLVRPAKTVVKEQPKPRSIEYFFTGSAGYSYESNANNSNTNRIGDSIAAISAALRTKIPIGAEADAVNLVVSTTSVRYRELHSQDADLLVGTAVYGHQLASRAGSNRTMSSGTAITDILNVGIEGKSIHEAGYGSLKGNFLTPSTSLARNNIPLSEALCGDTGKEQFCHSTTLSVAARYVFADVPSREYAASKIAGKVSILGEIKGLALYATGSVDFKFYTDFPGGRRDIVYVAGSEIEWNLNDFVALTAGLNFTYQSSTVSAAEWNGFSMGPQAKLVIKLN